jgi:hypothetical protein
MKRQPVIRLLTAATVVSVSIFAPAAAGASVVEDSAKTRQLRRRAVAAISRPPIMSTALGSIRPPES